MPPVRAVRPDDAPRSSRLAGRAPDRPDDLSHRAEDIEIVNRCIAGDSQSYRVLVEKYQKQIMDLIYRLTGDYAQAEDLAQETFVSAFVALPKFRGRQPLRAGTGLEPKGERDAGAGQAGFFSWLYAIAINKCRDYLKNKRKPEPGSASPDLELPDDRWRAPGDDRIQPAIDNLPDEYRVAFVLKHITELSYREMQAVLQVSVASLKVRVHRAREMLADALKRGEQR